MHRILALAIALAGSSALAQDLARIAELEDRRSLGGGELVSLAGREGDPATRARAVRALGRIQDPSAAAALLEGLADPEREVRLEAAFALGQIDAPATTGALVGLLDGSDAELRELAAEALGKRKALEARGALERLLEGDPEPGVRRISALALGFVGEKASLPHLEKALEGAARTDPELEWRVVYALGRIGGEEAVPALARAAGSPNPFARTFAALFLGRIASPSGAEALRKLASDADWMAAACAVRALGTLGADEASVAAVALALGHASVHVRSEACRALAALGAKKSAGDLFKMSREDPSPAVAREAFYAQVRLGSETARLELEALAPRGPEDRKAIAFLEAGAEALAVRLAEGDPTAAAPAESLYRKGPDRVRAALLSGLTEAKPGDEESFFLLLRGLANPDLAVRGSAADGLETRGDLRALGHLVAAYEDSLGRPGHYEVRETLVAAAAAIESGLALPLLEKALLDPAPSVRAAAAGALEKRTGKLPAIPETVEAYVPPPVDLTLPGTRVAIETEKGTLVVELYREEAPIHVANLLLLAKKKHYEGLTFHRVVPAFVVQGGDPRGDGWGDAGYTIRDEVNRRPFVRGTLGMPKAGKDTGGCQIFITHLPAPHLDGRYTAFGQVVEGLDVLDRIEVGDRILVVRVLE